MYQIKENIQDCAKEILGAGILVIIMGPSEIKEMTNEIN